MIRGGNLNHRDTANASNMRAQRLPGEVDDGLSMMTSALLTMLDTPTEEAGALQQQNEKYDSDEQHFPSSSSGLDNQFFTRPAPVTRSMTAPTEDSSREYPNEPSNYYGQPQFFGQGNIGADDQTPDLSSSMPSMPTTMRSNLNGLGGPVEGQSMLNQIGRIQSWQGSAAAGVIHENAQFSSMNPTQQLPSNSPNTSTNVGLYY